MASLANALGVIQANQAIDIEDCKSPVSPGIYGIGADTLNMPFRYGRVICFPHTNNNDQVKIAVNDSSGYFLAIMVGIGSWHYFNYDSL